MKGLSHLSAVVGLLALPAVTHADEHSAAPAAPMQSSKQVSIINTAIISKLATLTGFGLTADQRSALLALEREASARLQPVYADFTSEVLAAAGLTESARKSVTGVLGRLDFAVDEDAAAAASNSAGRQLYLGERQKIKNAQLKLRTRGERILSDYTAQASALIFVDRSSVLKALRTESISPQ